MFSRDKKEPHNSTEDVEIEELDVNAVTPGIVTGEEVDLDAQAAYVDPADLVGTENVDAPVADVAGFSGFEETVSLPTGRAATAEVVEESENVSPFGESPEDVLAHRDLPSFLSEETETITTSNDNTEVLRRSLITGVEEQTSAASQAPEPVAPQRSPEDAPQAVFSRVDPNRDSMMLAGATVLPTVSSKAPARWLSLILSILLVPVTWYLLSDASARLALADGNPMLTGEVNAAALAELVAGLVFMGLLAILATQSSLGLFVTGAIIFGFGVPFLVVPAWVDGVAAEYLEGLRNFNDFGSNIVAHLLLTGYTGVLAMAGIGMILSAWTAFAVRRAGRREESMRAMVAVTNPEGMQARWAKKATERNRTSQ